MTERTLKVKAPKGHICPRENHPRDFITDEKYVEVPHTTYYVRLVGDGSLLEEEAEKTKAKAGADAKKGG